VTETCPLMPISILTAQPGRRSNLLLRNAPFDLVSYEQRLSSDEISVELEFAGPLR
jgi:hypothetical protein